MKEMSVRVTPDIMQNCNRKDLFQSKREEKKFKNQIKDLPEHPKT
jgi:hypothetical protein